MAVFVQAVITGLAAGAGYGLVAIGFSLVYRLTGVVQFALGELMSLTIFVALLAAAGTGPVTATNVASVRFVLAIAAALAVAAAAGVLVYLLAVRPFLRRAYVMGWIGGTVAAAFASAASSTRASSDRATCSQSRFPSTGWSRAASSRSAAA